MSWGESPTHSSRTLVSVLAVSAVLALVIPATYSAKAPKPNHADEDDTCHNYGLVSVTGEVSEFLYDGLKSCDNDTGKGRVSAFVIDNETVVVFGPWWYWMAQNFSMTDFISVGDEVNVTGEFEEEDGTSVLMAWHIENLTTDEELTIKEEGRPPWAGGPKGLGIDPWPPSNMGR